MKASAKIIVLLLHFYCMEGHALGALSFDSIPPPFIVAQYNLPSLNWIDWLKCSHQNRRLEKLCQPAPVRNKAILMVQDQHSGNLNMGQIFDVFDYFKKHWTPIEDPYGQEYFDYAGHAVAHMRGDCDDFAIGLATSLRSIGALSRIVIAFNKKLGGHAYVQVCLGDTNLLDIERYFSQRYPQVGKNFILHVEEDKKGNRWLNLDSNNATPGGFLFTVEWGYVFVLGHPSWRIGF